MQDKKFFEFGPFRLDPSQRELRRAGRPISLTPKAFDTLLFLVERKGTLVNKGELLSALWPDTAVEEGNLAGNVSAVRKALADETGTTYIETVPKFGYRFVADVRETDSASDITPLPAPALPVAGIDSGVQRRGRTRLYVAALALLAIATGVVTYPWSTAPALAERDWLLIANIDNRTGQSDFDDVLTDTVAVQFDQSPYFRVFSQDRVDEQLGLMRRQAGERITESMAREICERAGVKAFISGSIAKVGPDFVVTLSAVNGLNGDAFSRNQQTVADAAGVLRAIGTAATAIRRDLGESLQSLERFDVAPEIATTSSLPALRAFREGQRLISDELKAIPFFRRAIELDPDFALAYARMATAFANAQDRVQSEWAAREAFNRRERASERERYEIDAKYYRDVTGQHSKSVEALELWVRLFPDDARGHNALQIELRDLGRITEAAEQGELATRLSPASTVYIGNLIGSHIRAGDFAAAKRVRDHAETTGIDTPGMRRLFRMLAAVSDDSAALEREEAWQRQHRADSAQLSDFSAGQAGAAGRFAAAQADYRDLIRRTDARTGRAALAREYLTRLITLESLLHPASAVGSARELQPRDPSRYNAAEAGLALAAANGDLRPLEALARSHDQDELLNGLWLPLGRAITEIRAGRHAMAVPLLRSLEGYDLGDFAALRPSYFLGQAHLALGAASDARTAFEKIIRNRGVVSASPLYALAHLGIARADALQKSPEARASYERFFEMWKDADAALLVMKAARTEYARLK